MSKEKSKGGRKVQIIATLKFKGLDREIIIKTDSYQYILLTRGAPHFHGSIADCFEDLFEWLVRERLIDKEAKNLKEVIEIMTGTKEEILKTFEPFEHLKPA